jgi:hypothetical protein
MYDPSLWEGEAGRSRVQDQPGLSQNPVSKQNKTKQNKTKQNNSQVWWLKPVIPATWQVESQRITVQG